MRRILLSTAVLLASTSLAAASSCVTAPVATYTASGFNCSVDGVTFSNITVSTVGNVTLGDFTPFTLGNENGLTLNYTSAAAGTGQSSDVVWNYKVTANDALSIIDAFGQFTGTISGTGTATLGEDLVNAMGTTVASISLLAPNTSQVVNFSPQTALQTFKDQQNFSGLLGSALTSEMTNAFSTVPGPIVGAGLPGLLTMLGLGGWSWRRRKRNGKTL